MLCPACDDEDLRIQSEEPEGQGSIVAEPSRISIIFTDVYSEDGNVILSGKAEFQEGEIPCSHLLPEGELDGSWCAALRKVAEGVFELGDQVRFSYRPADWEWLPRSNGPLGPYLPISTLRKADQQLAQVIQVKGGHLNNGYFAEQGEQWVLLRFLEPLGQGCEAEYDPEQLADWPHQDWPTDFAAPLSALTSDEARRSPFPALLSR